VKNSKKKMKIWKLNWKDHMKKWEMLRQVSLEPSKTITELPLRGIIQNRDWG